MSFAGKFFGTGWNTWNLDLVEERVKAFCKLVTAINYEITVFIETGYGTEFWAKSIYIDKENAEIENKTKRLPYNAG